MIKEDLKQNEELVVGLDGKNPENRNKEQKGFEIQWNKLRYCFEEKKFSLRQLETMCENCPL